MRTSFEIYILYNGYLVKGDNAPSDGIYFDTITKVTKYIEENT